VTGLPHAKRPCGECPWRLDATPGKFPAARYDALAATAGTPGAEAGFDAPIFACHMSEEGRDRACAGWLASIGQEHLRIRLAVAMGDLPPEALTPAPGWPALHPDYASLATANGSPAGRTATEGLR
jgi:Family of unknown function (DUF6283)